MRPPNHRSLAALFVALVVAGLLAATLVPSARAAEDPGSRSVVLHVTGMMKSESGAT